MKFTYAALSAVLSASALAYPGMQGDAEAFHKRVAEKRQGPILAPPDNIAASSNSEVLNCLSSSASCEDSSSTYVSPGPLGSSLCAADTCCVWDWVAKDLVALYLGSDGECTEDARGAIRLGFHDAGAWSTSSGFGGADGSMLLSADEINRSENNGLQDIVGELRLVLAKFAPFGVGAADLIQFSATVATVVCPLGPRVLSFVGRSDSSTSPTGLLPDVLSDADTLINLFADKTISPGDLAALVGAHTTSAQDVVDVNRAGAPQDTTPGVWDVLFYSQTLDPSAPAEIFKFPSDVNLANDARCAPSFQFFGTNAAGQAAWNDAFARAYVRLSLLGVSTSDVNGLVDCTKVLPKQVDTFVIPAPSNSTSTTSSASSSATASISGSATASGNSTLSYTYSYSLSASSTKSSTKISTTSSPAGPKKTESIPHGYFGSSYSCKAIPATTSSYTVPYTYTVKTATTSVTKSLFKSSAITVKPSATPTGGLKYPSCGTTTVMKTVTAWV